MIVYQHQVVRRTAGADLTEKEGCFVKLASGKLELTGAGTKAAEVYGALIHTASAGEEGEVALPGFGGIVTLRVAGDVADGDRLALAADGAVSKAGETATVVAVACGESKEGQLVDARLVEPVEVKASEAISLASSAVKVTKTK